MAFVSIDDPNFFTKESYREYLSKQSAVKNERYRSEDESFFDAMLSEEADFRKDPHGDEIVAAIRKYNG
jgi:hypothetical protein